MPLYLEIPDEVMASIHLPQKEAEKQLRADLAALLYERGALSMGKATAMAQMSRWDFENVLTRSRIARNYSDQDLQHDLDWSGAQTGRLTESA